MLKIVPLGGIELGFIPPFYIMRTGDYINLWDEYGTPLKPVFLQGEKPKEIIMSWSFSAIGTPEKIASALDVESTKMSGQSKLEFDAAKPHLQALLRENFAPEDMGARIVNFAASGSGSATDTHQINRSCSVKIEPMYVLPLI